MASDTRSALVAAAAELLDQGGPAAVTLREVGRKAGVSHNAPYKHFKSKEDLLAAIASRELERQSETMNALKPQARPIDALRRLTRGYIRWAQNYPARFRLVFGEWKHDSHELGEAAGKSRAMLVEIVKAAQDAHQLPRGNPERIASLLLALAHGAVDLALAGHLSATGKGAADPDMLADDLYALLKKSSQTDRKYRRK
ncbi:MAG TPA: TetR/AcrR family transcriptional regulator [Candidatus Binataceae bacterium]|nr:TetR/AcrR family transcriptional regulator [Candidatus Binataceae bacterium]